MSYVSDLGEIKEKRGRGDWSEFYSWTGMEPRNRNMKTELQVR